MKIEKAIEIGEELPDNLNNVLDYEQQDALKLLIEAGKREKMNRDNPDYVKVGLLPGETEE